MTMIDKLEDVVTDDPEDCCPVCDANLIEGEPHDTGCRMSGAR